MPFNSKIKFTKDNDYSFHIYAVELVYGVHIMLLVVINSIIGRHRHIHIQTPHTHAHTHTHA